MLGWWNVRSGYAYTTGQQVNFLVKGVRRARRFPKVDSRELCLLLRRDGAEGEGGKLGEGAMWAVPLEVACGSPQQA